MQWTLVWGVSGGKNVFGANSMRLFLVTSVRTLLTATYSYPSQTPKKFSELAEDCGTWRLGQGMLMRGKYYEHCVLSTIFDKLHQTQQEDWCPYETREHR